MLVIDEAGMIGTRQMERVISEAEKRGAKVVLVGDPEQLQAIEAGASFRSITERYGHVEITHIRRQRADRQRDATRQQATGRTAEAIHAYVEGGAVHVAETREAARAELAERGDRDRVAAPDTSRMILAHTNDEVRSLNELAREQLRGAGGLGADVEVETLHVQRSFAVGDRVMFLHNERCLGVKNGSIGRVDSITAARMAVMLDDGRAVAFDVKDYADIDHGYAATVHKAQGMTVDRVHVLATPGLDRHAAHVALSRHREAAQLHYGRDDFAYQDRLVRRLSRERCKGMASDYTRSRPVQLELGLRKLHPETKKREPLRAEDPMPAAVVRHAQIVRDMRFAQSRGEPYTPQQRAELSGSRDALDAIRPNARIDLETAMSVDHKLIEEAAEGQPHNAIKAIRYEARLRVDPQLRAETFVRRWQALDRQRRLLLRDHETSHASKISDTIIGMAKSLEHDP